jgi:hypothetical protein
MVRMKDVLKTYDELKKSPPEKDHNIPLQSADSGKLSGLDAIRQAIQSGLQQKKTEPSVPPTPTSQKETIDKIKSAITHEEAPKGTGAAGAPGEKPIVEDEEQQATHLYMDMHRMFEKIVSDIKNNTPIDPEPIIKQIPAFCTLIENNEFLFLKAIQRKRFATWVVSHSVNVGIFAVKIGFKTRERTVATISPCRAFTRCGNGFSPHQNSV